jgi:hypothetical protein
MPAPTRSAAAEEPEESPRVGLLYLPIWMLLWVALFFAARYLTKALLSGMGA